MFRRLPLVLAALLLTFAIVVALQPSEFRISRSRVMASPPEAIFAQVEDLRRWQHWSPWEKIDPNLSREYSGAERGRGAIYSWKGNEQVGSGRMTIVDSQPPDSLTIQLEFFEPWATTNTARFDLVRRDAGTEVTWSMSGHNGFAAKAANLLINVEKVVGADFERGLQELELISAAAPG